MDAAEIRNRTVSTLLAAFGAAATTATLLFMFQDSAETSSGPIKPPAGSKGKDNSSESLAPGIPKIGDGSVLFPDFVGGLRALSAKAKSANPQGLGWFDNMGQKTLILTKPEHVKTVLNKVTKHALWGGITPASEAFFGKSVLFVLEGDEWKKLRGILRDSFKMQRLDVLGKDVTSCAIALANRFQEYADSGKVVDANAAFSMYHLASVGKSSFNYDLDIMQKFPKPNDFATSFEVLLQELPRRVFHPDPNVREDYVSGTEDNIKWQRAAKTVRTAVMETVIQRLEDERRGGWTPRGDLLDSMIASYRVAARESSNVPTDPKRAAEIMMDAIGDNLVEIFFAGYNTSVVAMCVALYYLIQNPQLMREAQMEVDSVLPDDVELSSSLSSKQFPFLCNVFLEALRLVPPAPLVVRQTVDDITLDDVKVPGGTVTYFPAAYLHMDPQSWGSTVEQFDPSRWKKPIVPGSFIPFSGGARECIGRHFAELESVIGLAMLLRTFDFELDANYKFMPFFSGFGYRTANATDMKVCMNIIPKRRTDVSAFMHDWTPVKVPRKNSNPLFAGCEDDALPNPPKFD